MAPATIENITQNRNYREICDFYRWIIFTRTRSYDIWIHSFFNKPEAHLSLYLIIWWYVICLSHLTLWVRIPLRRGVLDTTLCDKVWQWLATGFFCVLRFPPPYCWKWR
jgi:hypothetical protein